MEKELTFDEIKALYPNEWVYLALNRPETEAKNEPVGAPLCHGKDRTAMVQQILEIKKQRLTENPNQPFVYQMVYTGTPKKMRQWISSRVIAETKTN